MSNNELLYFQGLCSRLKSNGFSWQHEDYLMLREILPKMGDTIEALEAQLKLEKQISADQAARNEKMAERLEEYKRVNDEYRKILKCYDGKECSKDREICHIACPEISHER